MRNAFSHRIFTFKGIMRLLRLTFVSGPRLLFTTRLSIKSASIMILLCAPALFLVLLTTVPSLIFDSPEQRAYYEFANILVKDPVQFAVLPLAALCALIALAVPATAPRPFTAVRS
jgi:hypothetical protein